MSKKKISIPILIILLTAGAVFYSYKLWWTKKDSHHILVSGNIEATEVKVSFKIPGRILKRLVDEGHVVKEGDLVAKLTDTFPGKTYEGKISFISSEAEFTPKQVQTQKERVKLVYRIKVDVENRNRELKPGMPADGEILLEGK